MNSKSQIASREMLGENLCLDYLNPVIADGQSDYFFSSYERLVDWGVAVGTVNTTEAKSLQAVAESVPPDATQEALRYARSIRDLLRTIFAPLATGDKVDADIETLNEVYARASEHRRLTVSRNRLLWVWTSDGHPGKMFWPVIPAAVDLLLSAELSRLRSCVGCSWLFLDTSKNHSRRWCRMKDCGNREKARSYRQRKKPSRI